MADASPADPATRLRAWTSEDNGFSLALFREQRQAQFAPLGLSDALLSALLDQQYRAQQTSYARDYPEAETLIIEHECAPVGHVIVALDPDGKTLHLVDIAIIAAARRQGIGTDVIGSLLYAAAAMGLNRCSLAVLASNQLGRQLYERLGFVATGGDAHLRMVKSLQ